MTILKSLLILPRGGLLHLHHFHIFSLNFTGSNKPCSPTLTWNISASRVQKNRTLWFLTLENIPTWNCKSIHLTNIKAFFMYPPNHLGNNGVQTNDGMSVHKKALQRLTHSSIRAAKNSEEKIPEKLIENGFGSLFNAKIPKILKRRLY